MSTAGTPVGEEQPKSKRPSSSAFKQQRLPAWQPILTAGTVLPTFFVIGIAFIPIGIGLLFTSNDVQEQIIEYTDCKGKPKNETNETKSSDLVLCSKYIFEHVGAICQCEVNFTLDVDYPSDVFMYYGLTNYYQNHRRYVKSRDDNQLRGNLNPDLSQECEPFKTTEIDGKEKSIAPCGAIANSMFNDSFSITWKSIQDVEVPLIKKGIAWETDKSKKFQNPEGDLANAFRDYAHPLFWNKNVYELDTDPENNGFQNEDLIVWMRTAALPTFRKLYRRINHSVPAFTKTLPKGDYVLKIDYAYPVKSFDGKKRVILSTTSWLGGKNPFLGIAYIVVGCICLVLGMVFLVIHIKFGRSTQEMSNITPRTGY